MSNLNDKTNSRLYAALEQQCHCTDMHLYVYVSEGKHTSLLGKTPILSAICTCNPNKVVLEPLVSPELAIYIFKQVKVKMTLDLVMSP